MLQAIDENGAIILPSRGIKAYCPMCQTPLISRCGSQKIHHFAHKGIRDCDSWYEPISEWHLGWQKLAYPYTEIVIEKGGVKHRADVRYPSGLIVEIQDSKLPFEQKNEREVFYQDMFWILNAKKWCVEYCGESNIFRDVLYLMKPSQDWFLNSSNRTPIFLDLGDEKIIHITEFEKKFNRIVWFWGKKMTKAEFIQYYFNEKFSDTKSIEISTRFTEYRQKKLESDRSREERFFREFLGDDFDNDKRGDDKIHGTWALKERQRRLEAEEQERLFCERTRRIVKIQESVPDIIEKEAREAIEKRDKELINGNGKNKPWFIKYTNPGSVEMLRKNKS
jgi:competence CoiA-like predicted nuclease